MAIQQRGGADSDFDPNKMLAREIAVTTDGTRKAYVAFAPGDVRELVCKEDAQKIVDEFYEANIDAQVVAIVESLFVPVTQVEYDALVEAGTVDDSKYYMIVGDI